MLRELLLHHLRELYVITALLIHANTLDITVLKLGLVAQLAHSFRLK